jgi:sugar lactone lactonase YvrE
MDCAGNVYASGGSIRNPQGEQIGSFSGGTNLAFGGPDGKTLFVVGGGESLKTIQMNVPGLP